jgi:adenylate cyclase
MPQEGFKRKLTAILSADVIGYSRLMRDDEEATVRDLAAHRVLITEIIQQHNGRVVDSPGDNILAEFASVVDAVNGAIKIQAEIKKSNGGVPEERRMEFRIGVNLGDVIEEEERIYGDGVNIAARVEGLAAGGGIAISGTVYEHIKEKLSLGYHYLGEQEVKNISEPVRVYRLLTEPADAGKMIGEDKPKSNKLLWAAAAAIVLIILSVCTITIRNYYFRPSFEPASVEKMALPLPEKPSIAVLPFDNMSGDPEQEYIADGIAENIITALSRFPNLFVIARNSSFFYKGKSVKIKQVSEELGVQYVLEGSFQKSGDHIRLTAQLIDAVNGHHLWAERYDGELKDLFTMQDDITLRILKDLQHELTASSKLTTTSEKVIEETNNIDAFLKRIEGNYYAYRETIQDILIARKLFEEAVALDPNYLYAKFDLAFTYLLPAQVGWSPSHVDDIAKAEEIHKELSLNESYRSSFLFYMMSGNISLAKGDIDKALSLQKKAVGLAPNSADGLVVYGWFLQTAGRYEEAIMYFEKAIRLNPYSRPGLPAMLAKSYHRVGRYEDAIKNYEKALDFAKRGEYDPVYLYAGLTFAYLELGVEDKALLNAAEALKLKPYYKITSWATWELGYKDQEYLKRLCKPLISLTSQNGLEKTVYFHTESPAFKFEYPIGSRKLEPGSPNDVLMMETPAGITFSAMVVDIPEGMPLKDFGPKYYKSTLERFGSKFSIISNKKISLKEGTTAYETEIRWLYLNQKMWIISIVVSTYKDGKCISIDVHPYEGSTSDVKWIPESLTLE